MIIKTDVNKYQIVQAAGRGTQGPAGGPTDILTALSALAAAQAGSPYGVYATTAALAAALPTGDTHIYVVAADGHWYYWNGSAWTDGGVYQATGLADDSVTTAKASFFDHLISRNIYDSALAQDGKLASYTTGGYSSSANYAMLGKAPVAAGKTYTLSMPYTETDFGGEFHCYNAAGEYLGLSHAVSSYTVATGITDGYGSYRFKIVANYRRQIIFSIASDSLIRFVDIRIYNNTAHTTEQFNAKKALIQLEESPAFTRFETYGTSTDTVDYDVMPTEVTGAVNKTLNLIATPMKVIKAGDIVYFRTARDATYDFVEKILLNDTTYNGLVEFTNHSLIPVGISDEAVPAYSMPLLKTNTDDIAPVNYNGSYMGANHGVNFGIAVTATGHGKTNVDVGSEWTDGAGRKFYIIKIVDANTLWMMSENLTPSDDVWSFTTSISGSTLTHSTGATNTGAITVGSSAVQQVRPMIKNETYALLLNGQTAITADGIYDAEFVTVTDSYDIISPASLLTYLIANVGTATEPDYADADIDDDVRMSINYRFSRNGSCTIQHSFYNYRIVDITEINMVQAAAPVIPSGGTLHCYAPGVTGMTYDLSAVADITALSVQQDCVPANWTDANNPPSRIAQFSKTSAGAKYYDYGFTLGYCTDVGAAVPATRKDAIDAAFFISTAKKMYPRVAGPSTDSPLGIVPANTLIDVIAFRCPINYGYDSDATVIAWYYVGQSIYLMLDYHTNVNKVLALPAEMVGRTVAVVEKSANMTVGGSFVSPDGIAIKVTGGYGYAVLKLT